MPAGLDTRQDGGDAGTQDNGKYRKRFCRRGCRHCCTTRVQRTDAQETAEPCVSGNKPRSSTATHETHDSAQDYDMKKAHPNADRQCMGLASQGANMHMQVGVQVGGTCTTTPAPTHMSPLARNTSAILHVCVACMHTHAHPSSTAAAHMLAQCCWTQCSCRMNTHAHT
jgi:hypothetical protein